MELNHVNHSALISNDFQAISGAANALACERPRSGPDDPCTTPSPMVRNQQDPPAPNPCAQWLTDEPARYESQKEPRFKFKPIAEVDHGEPLKTDSVDESPPSSLDEEFMPISAFLAKPPSGDYLVKGVLPASGVCQVFGCTHVGKSFFNIDLACHIALGTDWHGYRVRKSSVLYVAAEGIDGLKLRFMAWFLAHGVEPPNNLRIRAIPANLTSVETTAAIAERMAQLPEPPDITFVDTFSTNFGEGSENDDSDMKAAIAGLQRLRGNGLISSTHHTGHSDKTRGRGHSSLPAAIDVEIHVAQETDGIVTVGHTKFRDGKKLETIAAFSFQTVTLPWTDVDGDPLESAIFVPTEPPPPARKGLSKPARVALEALRAGCQSSPDGWTYVADWRKAALEGGVTDSDLKSTRSQAFTRARQELVDAGKVLNEGEKWKPCL